jgi:hypothetical protein
MDITSNHYEVFLSFLLQSPCRSNSPILILQSLYCTVLICTQLICATHRVPSTTDCTAPHNLLQSVLYYDRRSVGQSILVSSPHLGLMTRFFHCQTIAGFWYGAPSLTRGRVCLLQCTIYNTFYCLRFEPRSLYLYPSGTGWPGYAQLASEFSSLITILHGPNLPKHSSAIVACADHIENTASSIVAWRRQHRKHSSYCRVWLCCLATSQGRYVTMWSPLCVCLFQVICCSSCCYAVCVIYE